MDTKKRNTEIDILRGIGIIVMILGHIELGRSFYKWSHAFHMPLFFIVSGFFFNADKAERETKNYVLKKAKSLLLPYFSMAALSYMAWLLLKHDRPLLEPIYNILWLNQSGIPIATALWFLTCLFMTEIMFIAICRITSKNMTYSLSASVILSLLAYVAINLWNIELPWSAIPALMALPLYWFGWMLSNLSLGVQKRILNLPLFVTVILLVASCFTIQANQAVNMRTNNYGNYFLFYINAILATIALWNVSNKIKENGGLKSVINCISYVGRNSLIYLCMNQATITACELTIGHFISVGSAIFKGITFIVVMAADTCVSIVYNKTKKYLCRR